MKTIVVILVCHMWYLLYPIINNLSVFKYPQTRTSLNSSSLTKIIIFIIWLIFVLISLKFFRYKVHKLIQTFLSTGITFEIANSYLNINLLIPNLFLGGYHIIKDHSRKSWFNNDNSDWSLINTLYVLDEYICTGRERIIILYIFIIDSAFETFRLHYYSSTNRCIRYVKRVRGNGQDSCAEPVRWLCKRVYMYRDCSIICILTGYN